jgi:hypothetical protein
MYRESLRLAPIIMTSPVNWASCRSSHVRRGGRHPPLLVCGTRPLAFLAPGTGGWWALPRARGCPLAYTLSESVSPRAAVPTEAPRVVSVDTSEVAQAAL